MPKSKVLITCFLLYCLLGTLLFLRPHQETFFGLDSSSIRWMTHAMAEGRSQTGTDQALLRAPIEIRPHFLYIPGYSRLTRDRSFQLDDLETCRYQPFFYPALSYLALGFDRISPGNGLDFFLPALTLLFFIMAGRFMYRDAGLPGLAMAFGVVLGMPLLAWFARGYYPELAALILISIILFSWLNAPSPHRLAPWLFIILGIAVSLHPLVFLWAAATFILLVIDSHTSKRQILLYMLCAALGTTPLILMTLFVAQPYGQFFSLPWVYAVFQNSTLYALLLLSALTALMSISLLFFRPVRSFLCHLAFPAGTRGHILRMTLSLAPTILLLYMNTTSTAAIEGLKDLWTLLATPYGVLLGATILASLHPSVQPRSRALVITTIALSSIYLYLKGIEPFGLWSQRRLLPILIPFMVATLAVWRDILVANKDKLSIALPTSVGALVIAGIMFHQHAPFYLLRAESGSNAAVHAIREAVEGSLAIIDYHQYGSALAARGAGDVFALSNRISNEQQSQVLAWATSQADQRSVLWITAFSNPGLEQGVALQKVLAIRKDLPRLHARRAFPAQVVQHPLSMTVLHARPIQDASPPPRLDKILDRGPLALRGPWGRADISLLAPSGERLPARWTRQGSAVIGPLPAPGSAVRIELIAGAYQPDDQAHQVITITPPWPGSALELRVENTHSTASALLRRPEHADSPGDHTGAYILAAHAPYDPAKQGIRGFDADLGVLLHRIRIELVD